MATLLPFFFLKKGFCTQQVSLSLRALGVGGDDELTARIPLSPDGFRLLAGGAGPTMGTHHVSASRNIRDNAKSSVREVIWDGIPVLEEHIAFSCVDSLIEFLLGPFGIERVFGEAEAEPNDGTRRVPSAGTYPDWSLAVKFARVDR